ncbi:MAG TPA: penicillin-binding transpeptidase domain-containing protein, partial [Streptomyces sp.]
YTVFPEPKPPPKPAGLSGQTGYLVDTARAYLSAHGGISDERFDLGGYQIYTTFERPRVEALATAVKQQTSSLRPATRPGDRDVRVGAASVAADGRIVALYGGPDYVKQGFDDADIAIVPAGTAYAPFVYAAALRDGVQLSRDAPRTPVTAGRRYDGDDKVPLRTPEGPYWNRDGKIVKSANAGGRSWGRISLHEAVAHAVNGPIAQLGLDVGLNRVRQASIDAGLLPDGTFGEQNPAFSLGVGTTPSPIRLASAYTTFAASGTHTAPYSVLRVTHGGTPVGLPRPDVTHPFTPDVAHAVDAALHAQAAEGPVRPTAAGSAGYPGTTPDNTAASFMGYDHSVVTDVSLFRIDPKTQQLLPLTTTTGTQPAATQRGSSLPLAIWNHYTEAIG